MAATACLRLAFAACWVATFTTSTAVAFVPPLHSGALEPKHVVSRHRVAGKMEAGRAPGFELWRGDESVVTGPLSPAQIDEFYSEGFLIVRGLLAGELLERCRASTLQTHLANTEYETLTFNAWNQDPVWLEVARHAPIVQAVAQLTPAVASGEETLHVAKDAVFVFRGDVNNPNKAGCDWHVDDSFFWPAALDANGPGVNVWIALDDVTADGGGLCLSRRSHTADFLDCRESIRKEGTCDMSRIYKDGRDRLEAACVRPQMQPGDAILHTRFLFHRTDPFRKGSAALEGPGIRRYTVRYMPASARMTGVDRMGTFGLQFFKGQPISDLDPLRFPAVPVSTSSPGEHRRNAHS
jgi:hypothetical protein